jgi:hypothetical protein
MIAVRKIQAYLRQRANQQVAHRQSVSHSRGMRM